MWGHARQFSIFLIPIFFGALTGYGQAPGPPSGLKSDKVPGYTGFTSLDGRFTIGLPLIARGFNPLSLKTAEGSGTGEEYSWQVDDLFVEVAFADFPQPHGQTAQEPQVSFDNFIKGFAMSMRQNGFELASEKNLSLSGFIGREIRWESPTLLVISRSYVVNNRRYQLIAGLPAAQSSELEPKAANALDSFRIIPEDEVAALRKKRLLE